MNEKLLQYLWNFKIFKSFDFKDTAGNKVEILDFGKWNYDSGPDFLHAAVQISGLTLYGHIELHLKSSDWIFHRHSGNPEFENVILHAVLIHDAEIPELEERNVPTLELQDYIDTSLLWKYESLLKENRFIPCEDIFNPDNIPVGFSEETLLRKLDEKAADIEKSLKSTRNNYEAVLFQNMAYAFGLKVNAEQFKLMAEGIDFSLITKISRNLLQLEALFFGLCGWLDQAIDDQMKLWRREFDFLKVKYSLAPWRVFPKFSKLRPPNFPTIRLSQLASLYHLNQNLFSKMISARRITDLYDLFGQVKASEYWDTRFNFGRESTVTGEKYLSREFTDLVLLNAVLPLKYVYTKNTDEDAAENIVGLYRNLAPEKNSITNGWTSLGVDIKDAAQSQAFIYHNKHFCETKNCLNCSIGFQLLKKS